MSIQLAPDTEAGLRAEAAACGLDVDVLIATAVKAYLCNRSGQTPPVPAASPVPFSARSAEMAWAANPDAQFFGKWVVLEGGRVVASGPNPKQLYEDVRSGGHLLAIPHLCFTGPTRVRQRVDQLSSLDFDTELEYEETVAGILVPVLGRYNR